MGTVTSIIREKAKGPNLGTSPKRSELRWISDMMTAARALWPAGTAHHLAAKTNVSPRAAEFWLAGKYDMSLGAARELLRSEEGYEFLVALMGDCDARWWQRVKLRYDTGKVKRSIIAQQKRLAELLNETQQVDMNLD